MVKRGYNVFLTGPAGTGKSLVIDHIREHLEKSRKVIALTAPTGIAANKIGGQTIHSWCMMGPSDHSLDSYIQRLCHPGSISAFKWQKTDALILDEVSMVCLPLF